jgi:hypothetical protein
MGICKICGEVLVKEDINRGTCKDCEIAVSKIIMQKFTRGSYPRKVRIKI